MASSNVRQRALRQHLAWHLHEHHGLPKPVSQPSMPTLRAMHRREHNERTDLAHEHTTGSGKTQNGSPGGDGDAEPWQPNNRPSTRGTHPARKPKGRK